MDMTHTFWEENSNLQRVKYESCNSNDEVNRLKEDRGGIYALCDTNLNFSTATCSEDDCDYAYKKNKVTRQDPMSHRIIEKRRRDRMNNCLADLSRLIPTDYLKKGRGRIEKTEIIEMAIKHMKYLQQEHGNPSEHYRLGYQECMSEAMRFMVEVEGHFPREAICLRLLNHLQKHCESISRSTRPPQTNLITESNSVTHSEPLRPNQVQTTEFHVAKSEPEQNNNNFVVRPRPPSESEYDKHAEANGNSYKYKTNIKLRFNQDLNGQECVKRQKLENGRRNSNTSIENQSSSHSSPPSSEVCTRISEGETVVNGSPDGTAGQLRIEQSRTEVIHRFSKTIDDVKHNFNIPIFVLHAKGSYYIPLTIDYKTLMPFLHSYDMLEVLPAVHNIVLHPVTINVNFQPSCGDTGGRLKCEYKH